MNIESDLNDAISDAHLSLEKLDYFDLYSEDPESVKKFELLKIEHDENFEKVIELAIKLRQLRTMEGNP